MQPDIPNDLRNVKVLTREVLTVIINLEKMDPLEKERTYNIRKQQTRFFESVQCGLMESATALTSLALA